MPMNRCEQPINSKIWILRPGSIYSVDQSHMQPKRDESCGRPFRRTRIADIQRNRNDSKSRENFIPAAQGLKPGISVSFISFGLIVAWWIGGAHYKCDYLGSVYSVEQSRRQPKREINHVQNRSRRKGRATKKLRDFWRSPPAPKISESLEPLAFLKGSKSPRF